MGEKAATAEVINALENIFGNYESLLSYRVRVKFLVQWVKKQPLTEAINALVNAVRSTNDNVISGACLGPR